MPDTQDVFKQGLEQITGPTRSWLMPPGARTVAGANAKLVREMAKDLQAQGAEKAALKARAGTRAGAKENN